MYVVIILIKYALQVIHAGLRAWEEAEYFHCLLVVSLSSARSGSQIACVFEKSKMMILNPKYGLINTFFLDAYFLATMYDAFDILGAGCTSSGSRHLFVGQRMRTRREGADDSAEIT